MLGGLLNAAGGLTGGGSTIGAIVEGRNCGALSTCVKGGLMPCGGRVAIEGEGTLTWPVGGREGESSCAQCEQFAQFDGSVGLQQ
jgi:hypothetical protein